MRTGGYTLRMYGHSSTGVLGLSQDLRRARILRRIEEHKKNDKTQIFITPHIPFLQFSIYQIPLYIYSTMKLPLKIHCSFSAALW